MKAVSDGNGREFDSTLAFSGDTVVCAQSAGQVHYCKLRLVWLHEYCNINRCRSATGVITARI
jgi:hypothetical protein